MLYYICSLFHLNSTDILTKEHVQDVWNPIHHAKPKTRSAASQAKAIVERQARRIQMGVATKVMVDLLLGELLASC